MVYHWLQQTPRLGRAYFAAWLLSMIAFPLTHLFGGEAIMLRFLTISVILHTITVLLILHQAWGFNRTFSTALGLIIATWTVEFIGSHTGYPFGTYHYSTKIQPQIGQVPLIIPLAWLMMLPSAWALAQIITGSTRNITFMLLSGLALTTWDLFLDPQMVQWGLWVWAQPQGYFGIPWSNYLGWWLTATFLTALARPPQLPIYPLLLILTITWLLETIGLVVFWGLPGPALVGFISLGSLLGVAWLKLQRSPNL